MEAQNEAAVAEPVDEKQLTEDERIAKIMRELRAMMGYTA